MDKTLLRMANAQIEPTQSLALSGQSASQRTEDIGMLAPPPRVDQATRDSRPPRQDDLATGSSLDDMTSNERPGVSERRRRRSHTTAQPEQRVGQVLGKYRLTELIGRGGMGFVYRAEHVKLGRPVALKLLRSSHAERRDAVARFFQEARAVNRIRHRNICDATDFVELEDGTTFIIMELLEGASLRDLIRHGMIEEPRVLAMMIQICDALAAAHEAGIVHRDLKPDNVFIVPMGDGGEMVKLLDFGVAKLLHREEDEESFGFETAAGAVIGTPAYMSPEQAGGLEVDARSDIYSLGAIMYEMFTGRPPFRGKSFGEFVRKHLSDMPIPPSQIPGGDGLDQQIEDMLLQCLEKHPDDRHQSAIELKHELVTLLAGAATSISMISDSDIIAAQTAMSQRRIRVKDSPETAMAVGDVASAGTTTGPRGRWMLALAAVACLVTVFIVFAVSQSGSSVKKDGDKKDKIAAGTTATGAIAGNEPNIGEDKPPSPIVGPITRKTRDVPTNHITVHFESTPKAVVFRTDMPNAICTTPCNVTINTLDGGSQVSRNFLLRAKGHRDEPVTVHLAHAKPRRHIQLSRERRARRTRPPVTRKVPKRKQQDTGAKTTVQPKRTPSKPKDPDKKVTPTVDPTTTIDPFSRK